MTPARAGAALATLLVLSACAADTESLSVSVGLETEPECSLPLTEPAVLDMVQSIWIVTTQPDGERMQVCRDVPARLTSYAELAAMLRGDVVADGLDAEQPVCVSLVGSPAPCSTDLRTPDSVTLCAKTPDPVAFGGRATLRAHCIVGVLPARRRGATGCLAELAGSCGL